MCGRYGRRADKQRIAEWMQTHDTNVLVNGPVHASDPVSILARSSFAECAELERATTHGRQMIQMIACENGESYKTDAGVLRGTITSTVQALGD